MQDTKKHRKNFAIVCTIIGAAVTVVSLAMTYFIFTESFRDWPGIMRGFLTLSCCIAIECTASALIYGLVYTLTGLPERGVAFAGLSAVGILMGINISGIRHTLFVNCQDIVDIGVSLTFSWKPLQAENSHEN